MPKISKKSVIRDSVLTKFVSHPAGQLAAFAAFVFTIVLLVTSDFDQNERMLRELVVGDAATRDVIASRDFTYVQRDDATTRLQREQAADETPAIFDWQEGLNENIRERINEAFSTTRKELARTLSPKEPDSIEAIGRADSFTRLAIARDIRPSTFDAALGVQLRDSDYDAFARNGFTEATESQLVELVAEVMSNIIVPSRRILEDERERGVHLRRVRDGKVLIEYHVTDIDARFVSMEQTPALVEEAAATSLVSIGERELRNAIASAATSLVRPNTSLNQARTLERRATIQSGVAEHFVREDIRKGQVLIHRNEIVTQRHRRQIDTMLSSGGKYEGSQGFAGVVLFALIFVTTLHIFGRRNMASFNPNQRDLIFMASSMVVMLFVTRMGMILSELIADQGIGIGANALYYAIPVAAAGMLIRLVLSSEHAAIFAIVFALLVGVMADNSLYFASYAALGGFVGAGTATQVRSRLALLWSGLVVGGVNSLGILAFLLMDGTLLSLSTFAYLLLGVAGGLASGFLVSALLPIVESLFEYTTDVKLLELANLNHPALRELIMRAPGSYHHSMMVSSLCEAAAEAVGCNSLLARVGAYYHDIGKAKNPGYFAENQKLGINPHDKLKPNMSALIIKAHVKDGLEMARQHRLPKAIQDFIAQHHGTSLIAYFYHKAKQQEDPDIQEVDEKDYRYPGPLPQTRETAICLLADGVEAASRAMQDPTPAKLRGLVQNMISHAFTTGQLDECDLTLKDLNVIAATFNRILTGIYHHRPEYPGEKKGEKEREPRERMDTGDVRDTRRKNGKKTRDEEVTTSDVWEITAERVKSEEEDASGPTVAGESGKPPGGGASRKNDKDSGRSTLPRLGSG